MIQVSTTPVPELSKIPTASTAPMNQAEKNQSMTSEPSSDFNEDPFKNYRYEDPFMISDPFHDEEAPVDTVKGNDFICNPVYIINEVFSDQHRGNQVRERFRAC